MMKRGKRLTGTARVLGLLVVLALLFGLLLPLVKVSAQESDGDVSGKVEPLVSRLRRLRRRQKRPAVRKRGDERRPSGRHDTHLDLHTGTNDECILGDRKVNRGRRYI